MGLMAAAESMLVPDFDEKAPRRVKVKCPRPVKFLRGLGVESAGLQSFVELVYTLTAFLHEADVKGTRILDLGCLLEIVQRQDKA